MTMKCTSGVIKIDCVDGSGKPLFNWDAGGDGDIKTQELKNNETIVGIYGYTGNLSWITNFGFLTVQYI